MGPKQTNGGTPHKKHGKESVIHKVLNVDPKMRTVEQWLKLGKETLTLTANSFNIAVKGRSSNDIAKALVAHFGNAIANDKPDFAVQQHCFSAAAPHLGRENPNNTMDILDSELESSISNNFDLQDEENPSTPTSTKKLKKRSFKAKHLATRKRKVKSVTSNFDADGFKNDLVAFLRDEIKTQLKKSDCNSAIRTQTEPSPSFAGIQPQPPFPSGVLAAGSLEQQSNHNGNPIVILPEVETGNVAHCEATVDAVRTNFSSIPSTPPVPKRVLEIIKKCEYVNFDLLLPPTLNAPLASSIPMDDIGEYDLNVRTVDGSPSVSLIRKNVGKSRVKDFKSWCLAWSNYLRCVLSFFPHLCHEMITYQTLVTQFANQYAFSAIYAFDQLHRLHMANDPSRRWDVIDDLLFNQYLRGAPLLTPTSSSQSYGFSTSASRLQDFTCFSCSEKGHFASSCPNRLVSGFVNRFRNAPFSSQVCRRFNQGHCRNRPCQYSHRCSRCHQNHPAINCPPINCPPRAPRQGSQ